MGTKVWWTDHRLCRRVCLLLHPFASSTDDWLLDWLVRKSALKSRRCRILSSPGSQGYPQPSLHQICRVPGYESMMDSWLRITTATNKPATIFTMPQRDMLEVIVQVITHKSFAAIDSLFLILKLSKSQSVGRSRFCSTWERPIAVRCFQPRIIPSIREEGDKHTEQRACRDVVNIMTVIFTSRYCYQCCANKWC